METRAIRRATPETTRRSIERRTLPDGRGLPATRVVLSLAVLLAACALPREAAGNCMQQVTVNFTGPPDGPAVALGDRGTPYLVAGGRTDRKVVVFDRSGFQWNEVQTLINSDYQTGDAFGQDVAAFEDVIVVGAPEHDVAGVTDAGAVYVFGFTSGAWVQTAILTAPNPQIGDAFGRAVAIRGDVIAVGMPRDADGASGNGMAHFFRLDAGSWVHDGSVTGLDTWWSDLFGSQIALDVDRAIVGAPQHSATNEGAAYVFAYDGLDWQQQAKLTAVPPDNHAEFGTGLAIRGDYAVVGAPRYYIDSEGRGAAFVYRWSGSTWDFHHMLFLPQEGYSADYGISVAIDDGLVLVGSPGAENVGSGNRGAAYLYEVADATGTLLAELYSVDWGEAEGVDLLNGWAAASGRDSSSGYDPSLLFPIAVAGSDCNANGVNDACDFDCNSDSEPDACQGVPDCDGNGFLDTCDLRSGRAQDCNANLVPDACDIADSTSTDCNADTVPDECTIADGSSVDCNLNAMPDECDIQSGTSADCNTNAIPDECEVDCNANAVPDDCDIAGGTSSDCNFDLIPDECQPVEDCNNNGTTDICDIGAGVAQDCNTNLRPDACDIADGISDDDNGNGIPEECEARPRPDATFHIDGSVRTCTTDADCLVGILSTSEVYCIVPPPVEGGDGTCYVQRNKYISMDPNPIQAGILTARRVSLVLDGGGTTVLGWVGEPMTRSIIGPEPPVQLLSRVEAEPHYRDWGLDNEGAPWADPTVHLGDCRIAPGYVYHVQSIPMGADILDEANYSAPLELRTVTNYGDVTGPSLGQPPDRDRNFKDINALVRGFQGDQTESKVWLDLYGPYDTPSVPDFSNISLSDINVTIAGFQGATYPYYAPCDCPGQPCE